jgi:hypothetical protein
MSANVNHTVSQPEPTIDELIEAFNNPEAAEKILQKYGFTKEDLSSKAEILAKELADECTHMNMV